MTGRGIAAVLLFALLLLAGFATGISEIFVAAFMAGFLLAFALASALAGAFALRVKQSVSSAALVRGGIAEGRAVLEGLFVLPAAVRCVWASPAGGRLVYAALRWGKRPSTVSCPLLCPHRGAWEAGIVRLTCGDVFGLFCLPVPASRHPAPLAPLLVYPELYAIPGQPPLPPASMEYSEKNTRTADQGDSFSDTRLYRSGDPLKRIHWKLSIRTGELHTRQYEMSLDQRALILLDDSVCGGEDPEAALGYADMAAECAAALAYYYLSHRQGVLLLSAGERVDAAGPDDFDELYTALAGMAFDAQQPAAVWLPQALADLRAVCACYVITRRPSDDVLDCLKGVPAPRRPAVLVCPSAADIPKEGEALEQGLRILPVSAPRDILARLGGVQ